MRARHVHQLQWRNTNFDSLVIDSGTPDFLLSSSPASMTIGLTSDVQYTATVEMTTGFSPSSIDLWVTGLPPGVSGTFSPDPLPHEGTSTLTLTGDGTPAAGTYPITVGATADSVTHAQVVTLVVSSQPDFALAVTPLGQEISAGGLGVDYEVRLGPLNHFSGPVTLSVAGLPAGVSATFSPQPASTAQPSRVTLTAASTTAQGSYALQIVGNAGALTHSTPISLGVRAGRVWSVDHIGSTGTQNNSMLVGPAAAMASIGCTWARSTRAGSRSSRGQARAGAPAWTSAARPAAARSTTWAWSGSQRRHHPPVRVQPRR